MSRDGMRGGGIFYDEGKANADRRDRSGADLERRGCVFHAYLFYSQPIDITALLNSTRAAPWIENRSLSFFEMQTSCARP
jgi:hypothetical protein